MNYTIKLLPEADMEYSDAAVWYEKQKAGLGNRFIMAVEAKMGLIARSPEKYPERREHFREARIDVFPYVIVFTVHKKEKVITIPPFSIPAGTRKRNTGSEIISASVLKFPVGNPTV